MDNSGSMGDSIQGEAQSFFHLQQTTNSWTALEVCKNCLLDQILPQRLSAIDSVGFIAFNHSINVDVRLDSWQGAHRAHLESKLRSVMPEGQTNMWTAVDYAVRQLLQSSGKRSKWLVALTDGASHDNAHDVERLLNAEGKDVHVLFITVNLSENDRRAIETAIRRTENDGMFSASDVSSLEQAWKDVGERLTVSQRIEKQGESITTAETERLLRKYMKLDGAHSCWSRMKQMHWIQYLYRRCGILAASETFNKNQDKPAFGSTTMTIMLEEVLRVSRLTRFLSLLHFQLTARPCFAGRTGSRTGLPGRLALHEPRAARVLSGGGDERRQAVVGLQVEHPRNASRCYRGSVAATARTSREDTEDDRTYERRLARSASVGVIPRPWSRCRPGRGRDTLELVRPSF
eukprot:scaffold90121_cov30-Tisochrysis_lutea.AAC.9